MSPLCIWNPTQCSLQLVFTRPGGSSSSSSSAPILAGASYQGTSVIRYRLESLTERKEAVDANRTFTSADGGTHQTPQASLSEYDEFLQHRRRIAEKHALHLHALTVAGGMYKDAKPLQVTSYQVNCVSVGSGGVAGNTNSSKSGGAKTGVLKVLSVEQEDAAAAATSSTADKKQKVKAKANKKNASAAAEEGATLSGAAGGPSVDWGSKLVVFEGSDALPLDSEVCLTVQFTGTVQAFDHGGIYAAKNDATANNSSGASGDDVPLLTHLEVRFARCAFPCPDDPQYRLEWQLKSLQLPDTFATVLTNGEAQGQKSLPAQHAVQFSFAPCGPLPAYLFSFACFPEVLEQVETTMEVAEFTGDVANGLKAGHGGTVSSLSLPVRALARRQARIPAATLERVLRVTQDAIAALQQLFDCPLPLLQCRHLDVLLGPTMPFISGMEHHCSIILNETIYQSGKKAGGNANNSSSNAEVEQTELIVHESAHHWMGNALGLPFPVKEGICQVLEQCLGDTLLGKPMRKFKPDSAGVGTENAKGSGAGVGESTARGGSGGGMSTIQASEKGHEFTGTSYQQALSAIKRLVADRGFETFGRCLQHLVHEEVVMPTILVEGQGGAQMMRCIGAAVPPPPYLSTEDFLRAMEVSL